MDCHIVSKALNKIALITSLPSLLESMESVSQWLTCSACIALS